MSAPMLGYVGVAEGGAVWPILGMPGAAVVGDSLKVGLRYDDVRVAPSQDYFLTRNTRTHRVFLGSLPLGASPPAPIPGAMLNPGQIVFSPRGGSAVLFRLGRAQVLSGLPQTPRSAGDFDLTGFPGTVSAFAANDDGSLLLVAVSDRGSAFLYRLGSTQDARLIASGTNIVSIAFAPNGTDAVFADSGANSVSLIRDVPDSPVVIPLAAEIDGISSPVGVAVSPQGNRALVANGGTGTVAVMTFDGAPLSLIQCACTPTMLQSLNGRVYRLNDFSGDPLWIIDAGSPAPVIAFVPPPLDAQVASGGRTQPR